MSTQSRTVFGLTAKEITLHGVAAFVSGGTIYALTDDVYAGTVATIIGAVWFFLGIIYGYGKAVGV